MEYTVLLLAGAVVIVMGLSISSCVSIPKGATPVSNFKKDRYLGLWYEIARLDFKFEKGLDYVTATYSFENNNYIRVFNKGYKAKKQKWVQSVGKAKFVGPETQGRLKVSFFGPFYGGYNVIEIDDNYTYALVAGNNLKYLWLLSRVKNMPEEIKKSYLAKAKALGYAVDKLIWTKQD